MTRVSVQITRDRAPITSSSDGVLVNTLGHRYSGDVPGMQHMPKYNVTGGIALL